MMQLSSPVVTGERCDAAHRTIYPWEVDSEGTALPGEAIVWT